MIRPRCPDCIRRLPDHGLHLCPLRHQDRGKPVVVGGIEQPERSDRVHHAAILHEAGWTWAGIVETVGGSVAALQVAVSRRYPPRSRAA